MPDNLIRRGLDYMATQSGYPGMDMPQGQGRPEPTLSNILSLLEQKAMYGGGQDIMSGASGAVADIMGIADETGQDGHQLVRQFFDFLAQQGQQGQGGMIPDGQPVRAPGAMTYTRPGMSPMRR